MTPLEVVRYWRRQRPGAGGQMRWPRAESPTRVGARKMECFRAVAKIWALAVARHCGWWQSRVRQEVPPEQRAPVASGVQMTRAAGRRHSCQHEARREGVQEGLEERVAATPHVGLGSSSRRPASRQVTQDPTMKLATGGWCAAHLECSWVGWSVAGACWAAPDDRVAGRLTRPTRAARLLGCALLVCAWPLQTSNSWD